MPGMDEKRAAQLLGSPERRATLNAFEVRAGTGSTFTVRGYASVVDHAYDVYGGPSKGGWSETVSRGAFDTTLAAKPDVSFLINHDGMPLARTRSGTLNLRADNTGLEAEADVDRRDPFGQALEVKMDRGDLDQMSFGFRVTRQSWNEDYTERTINEVNLDHGDVSVVNEPANPATSIGIVGVRSALEAIRKLEMAEIRGDLGANPAEELRAAMEHLRKLIGELDPRSVPNLGAVEVEVVPVVRTAEAIEAGRRRRAEILRGVLVNLGGEAPAGVDVNDEDTVVVAALAEIVNKMVTLYPARAAEPVVETPAEEVVPEERAGVRPLAKYREMLDGDAA